MGIYSCCKNTSVETVYYAVTMFSMSVNWVLKAVNMTNKSVQSIYMAITILKGTANPPLWVVSYILFKVSEQLP